MSDNVVARLRTERLKVPGVSLFVIAARNLDDLLDVVERFAAVEPIDDHIMVHEDRCLYCNALVEMEGDKHAPDCPWLLARRLCGLEKE